MGRPSSLDDRQRAEIGRRLALGGEGNTVTALAKEFRVGKATISRNFSERTETIKTIAHALADTERVIEGLPVSEQTSIRTLADQLKAVTHNLTQAAATGSRTAVRLHEMASKALDRFETSEAMEDKVKEIANTNGYLEMANTASAVPLKLIAANKEVGKVTEDDLTLGRLLGNSRATG